jgi:hypothetical protein
MRSFWRGHHWTLWATLAAVGFFLCLVARFYHPVYGFTAFLQLSEKSKQIGIAPIRETSIFAHEGEGGYDGQYYAQIAYDPTLRNSELKNAADNLSYRARRILPPALAWLLAAGQPGWIADVYSLLNVIFWIILAALCWKLLQVRDLRTWLAWAGLLFSAGALHSVRLALTDLIATTFIAAALYARERNRSNVAALSLAAASLSKETAFLSAIALLRGPWNDLRAWARNLLGIIIAATPLIAWLIYICFVVGPADQGFSNFTAPFSGIWEKWGQAIAGISQETDWLLAWSTLLAVVGVTAQLFWLLLRPSLRDISWWASLPYVALAFVLSSAVWEGHPGAFTRVLLPLQFFFTVGAVRRGASIALIILGHLSVLSGVIALQNTVIDTRELANGRSSAHSVVVIATDGWFSTEHRKLWSRRTWASGNARIVIKTWPAADTALVHLEFSIRGHTPRQLKICQNSTVLWEGNIGTDQQLIRLSRIVVEKGTSTLDFITVEPSTLESAAPGARNLAFALYDLRIKAMD